MYRKIFSVFFAAIVITASGIAFMSDQEPAVNSNMKKQVNLDYSDQYPLPEIKEHEYEKSDTDTPKIIKKAENIKTRVLNKIDHKKNEYRDKVNDDFRYKTRMVVLKNYYQRWLLGMDMTTSFSTENSLTDWLDTPIQYSKNSDYLCGIIDNVDITENVDKLIDFKEYLESRNIDFVYFHTPGKYASNEAYKNYSSEKDAELLDKLNENDIDHIYFDDHMPKDEDEYLHMFYKTDHHWLPSTGIYANKVLCEYLNNNYGYDIDTSVFELNNYDVEIAEKPFLGSWGKKVTEAYAKPEPFEIYYPKYKLDLDVYNTRYDEYTHGDIKDTLFNYDVFYEEDIYSRNNYGFYGLWDPAYCKIHNNEIDDGSHVLMIKTSFADCMYSYLPAVFEDIDVIDLRYFGGSLESFIEKNKPDIVIMVYGIASFDSTYTEEQFDFR